MEDLGTIIAIFAFVGTPIAAWVVVKVAIAKSKVEIDNLKKDNDAKGLLYDKQMTAIEVNAEKEITRLENDYKERLVKVEKDQKDHERAVDRNFEILFRKLEDDKEQILQRLVEVTREIGELKGKLSRE